jgi:hypothetical protein
VGEHEYPGLKREKSIIVDFKMFPLKVIELIQQCLKNPAHTSAALAVKSENNAPAAAENSNSNSNSNNTTAPSSSSGSISSISGSISSPDCSSEEQKKEQPSQLVYASENTPATFSAKLDVSSEGCGVFSIMEANHFKHTMNISLNLKPGDDAAIKHYLASRLSLTLEVSKRQAREAEKLSQQLQSESSHNERASHELVDLRSQLKVDRQNSASSHSQVRRQGLWAALIAQSLRSHCAVIAQSLHSHCAVIAQSLRSDCAVIAQSLRSHCTVIAQSLRSHCAVIAQSLRSHCAVIAQSLRSHCAVIAQSLRSHCAVIAQSLSSEWKVIAQ